jgi:hypothetical protein
MTAQHEAIIRELYKAVERLGNRELLGMIGNWGDEPAGRPDRRAALVAMLATEIEATRFPLSPRIVMLKRIRAKLRGKEPAPREPPRPRRARG